MCNLPVLLLVHRPAGVQVKASLPFSLKGTLCSLPFSLTGSLSIFAQPQGNWLISLSPCICNNALLPFETSTVHECSTGLQHYVSMQMVVVYSIVNDVVHTGVYSIVTVYLQGSNRSQERGNGA